MSRASDTAQWVKVLAAKPDDLSLNLGTHRWKERAHF